MAPTFTLRGAELADGTALAELDRRTWSPLHAVSPRPQPPYAPFFDSGHRPSHIIVAELAASGQAGGSGGAGGTGADGADGADGAGIVGYIRVVHPTPLPSNAHVRQIQGLAVDGAARGLGIARALLEAACARAAEQYALRMTLRVLGHNKAARRLYESAGFEVEGVLPGEFLLEGEYVDDVLMGRRLTRR
ncbi:GNAT family N-acetyltransferase [Streptomyces sp. N2-109]|uniref:GNAT family N-acetyltransferase n=1 Tax=Streptomyces gossypii TaxID=2883101 RepID=A0ABT2K129_9ACTN|nr:N-acetyltransferase [Streptomyces gossypii]MCT2593245.1 GNAT family N-acetyltransferase [Streptomyces gossypii]